MDYFVPKDGARKNPAWWRPLERLAALVDPDPSLPLLLPCEFMFMGRVDRKTRPNIWEYKHKYSRRYLRIDDELQLYRLASGRYLPLRGDAVHDALFELELEMFSEPERDELCAGCRNLLAVRRGEPEVLAEVIPLRAS